MVKLLLPQVVHILYNRILMIKKFIPTQESTENIVIPQVMMRMHGASIMIFQILWHSQVVIRIFILPISFNKNVTVSFIINFTNIYPALSSNRHYHLNRHPSDVFFDWGIVNNALMRITIENKVLSFVIQIFSNLVYQDILMIRKFISNQALPQPRL